MQCLALPHAAPDLWLLDGDLCLDVLSADGMVK